MVKLCQEAAAGHIDGRALLSSVYVRSLSRLQSIIISVNHVFLQRVHNPSKPLSENMSASLQVAWLLQAADAQ